MFRERSELADWRAGCGVGAVGFWQRSSARPQPSTDRRPSMSTRKARCAKYLGLLGALAVLPAVSQADTLDYSFAELGYVDSEFGNLNGDGISLRGSVPVNETFFVFASYWDVGYDFNVDLTSIEEIGRASCRERA